MKDDVIRRRRIWLGLVSLMAALSIALWDGAAAGAAQPVPADDAVRAAVERLTMDGYVAEFHWTGTNPLHGEVRFGSPLAYGMRVTEEETDTTVEYLLLDPDLYSREIPSGEDMPTPWVRRVWHADVPIAGLTGYPPGLPLELLRHARDLAGADVETVEGRRLRRIAGATSYYAALIASYNDVPAPTERQQTLAATQVPLRVWLDEAMGTVARVEITIPDDAAGLPPGTLTYDFTASDAAQALEPPDDAREVESGLLLRPGPTESAVPLPISLSGSGRLIVPPPFVTTGGNFRITLTPTSSDLQYQLWRVKRGRQLIAGLGTLVGPGGSVTIPFVLQPGEYVFEVQLPEAADWTLMIEEVQQRARRDRVMVSNQEYARPELLAEPEWLWEHRDDPSVRVVDCATLEAYRRAHIPGAVGLPVHIYIKDPADETFVMPPEAFAELMGRLGISDDTTVVSYDDNNSLVATRFWWVLNYYGHTNAKVLNGGWHRWLTEGRPVTFHQTHPQPGTFTPRANESLICRVDDLKAKIDAPGVQIMDVRTDEEWLGTNNRGNKRAGHVPGAVHLEWLKFVTSDDRRVIKPAAELRAMLTEAGISPESEVVTY